MEIIKNNFSFECVFFFSFVRLSKKKKSLKFLLSFIDAEEKQTDKQIEIVLTSQGHR